MGKNIPVKVGDTFKITAIRWNEPYWEFDCPTAILFPVFRPFEDGRTIEYAIESILIDACIDGHLHSSDPHSWDWRGWTQEYLRRKQYRKNVEREVVLIRFILDEDGELFWTEVY